MASEGSRLSLCPKPNQDSLRCPLQLSPLERAPHFFIALAGAIV